MAFAARRALIIVVSFACVATAGCRKMELAAGSDTVAAHGRFAGVGVTDAGVRWSRAIIANRPAKDSDAAKTVLDDHVIVVVDTATGAIRQCGDISGYCIGEKTLDPTSPTRAVDVAKVPKLDASDAKAAAEEAASDADASAARDAAASR